MALPGSRSVGQLNDSYVAVYSVMHFVSAVAGRASDVDEALGSGPGGVYAWHKGGIQLSKVCNACQQIAANLGSDNAQPGARQSPHSKWVTSSWSFVPFFLLLRWRLQGPCCLQGRRRQLQLLPASWICPGTPITRTCRSARRWVPSRLGLKELCIVLGKCECGEQSMMCRLMRVAWPQPCPVHPGASNAEHQALVQRSWLLA